VFHTDFLMSSLLWGSIGAGCLVYGKKQSAAPAIIAGLGLIVTSFVPSALLMAAISLLLLCGMVWGIRHGY